MMTDLKPCSRCGNEDIEQACEIGIIASDCFCFCPKCGARSPAEPSQEQARAAWNRDERSNVPYAHRNDSDSSG